MRGSTSTGKPTPVIEGAVAKSYAILKLAAVIIGEAVRSGKRIPEDIWDETGIRLPQRATA